ncbi:MAG: hypothetical protein IKL18_06655 [Oscillospiraceae bacterium]|nr:hypothetical protein [Oscillospiraceae bacterium]
MNYEVNEKGIVTGFSIMSIKGGRLKKHVRVNLEDKVIIIEKSFLLKARVLGSKEFGIIENLFTIYEDFKKEVVNDAC